VLGVQLVSSKEVAKLLRAELQGCGRVGLLREWIAGELAIQDILDPSHFETHSWPVYDNIFCQSGLHINRIGMWVVGTFFGWTPSNHWVCPPQDRGEYARVLVEIQMAGLQERGGRSRILSRWQEVQERSRGCRREAGGAGGGGDPDGRLLLSSSFAS